jgi:hypothetical protein
MFKSILCGIAFSNLALASIHSSSEMASIGNGAINEKERSFGKQPKTNNLSNGSDTSGKTNFDPQKVSSHLIHALEGLQRYPNYLSRWNYDLEDADRLEASLEEQLAKVRLQKRQVIERNAAIGRIVEKVRQGAKEANTHDDTFDIFQGPSSWEEVRKYVLHPRASEAIFGSRQFQQRTSSSNSTFPTVQEILDGKLKVELDLHNLADWVDEECFDIYSFPLLSKTFCVRVKNALKAIIDESKRTDNDMIHSFGRRPVDLDSIGISWLNNLLFHLVIRPLGRQLFGKTEGFEDLDWRQGYIAGYSHKPSEKKDVQRQGLVPHTDDSEVTLNIGLGDEDFLGGDLAFWNLRGTRDEGNFVGTFHPQIGHALLHSGRHLHEVEKVTHGDRFAFIIWARSWGSNRDKHCPCCWMMRRQTLEGQDSNLVKHRCISGPHWN